MTALYPGHTAEYDPLGVVAGMLYLTTDREAPNKRVVAVPIPRPSMSSAESVRVSSRSWSALTIFDAGRAAVVFPSPPFGD